MWATRRCSKLLSRGQLVRAARRHAARSATARTTPRCSWSSPDRLGVFVEDEQGERRLVAHIPAGETVGEMSLISGEHEPFRPARGAARHRTAAHQPEGFEALIARHPRVMMNLMRMLVKRLQDTTRSRADAARPKTFAIVPLQDGLGDEPIAQRLAAALVEMGSQRRGAGCKLRRADRPNGSTASKPAHDIVFYRGDAPDSAWTHLCLRQADRIFLLARADQPLPLRPLDLPAFKERASGPAANCCCCIPTARSARAAGAFRAAQRPVRIPSSCARRPAPTTSSGWRASSPAAPWAWCWPAAARAALPISASSRR